jgi:hypothetical protein
MKLQVEEQEAELELRDYNPYLKSSMPTTLKHHEYSCIGTETCFKQKAIPKLFLDTLKQMQNNYNGSEPTLEQAKAPVRSVKAESSKEEKAYNDFIQLMDSVQKNNKSS